MLQATRAKIDQLFHHTQHRVLNYLLDLHERALHAPIGPLQYSWPSPWPSAQSSHLVFSCFENSLIAMDILSFEPRFALEQILNILSLQDEQGFIPAQIILNPKKTQPCQLTSPPLWALVLEDILDHHELIVDHARLLNSIEKLIAWFDKFRKNEGYYYLDILDGFCESHLDLQLRMLDEQEPLSSFACVDASSHLYLLTKIAAKLSESLSQKSTYWQEQEHILKEFIQKRLYSSVSHCFGDSWLVDGQKRFSSSYLTLWPLFVGAANSDQVAQVLQDHILNSQELYTPHPIASIARSDEKFGIHGWKGPVRMSFVWILCRALMKYYHMDTPAQSILHDSLQMTFKQFERTNCLWEAYHPLASHPQEVICQEGEDLYAPRPHDLTHNPLLAMSFASHRKPLS